MTRGYELFVGIDWGSEAHQVCVLAPNRKILLERSVPHSGTGMEVLRDALLALHADVSEVCIAIETPRGTVVNFLLEHGFAVFALNPKQLDRFRDRHTVAGAKDDRRDAFVLADSLRTDEPLYRRVQLDDPLIVQLRELTRVQEDLTKEEVALGNRLRDQVSRYFPQLIELGSLHDEPWLWALLERASTPQEASRLSVAKLRTILKEHRIRRHTPEYVREVLSRKPLPVAPGVLDACRMHISMLLPRLRLVHEQLVACGREMERVLDALSAPIAGADGSKREQHRDAYILLSLPGVGSMVSATMLVEASQALSERDYATLRALAGVAPVTRATGKRSQAFASKTMRYACNRRLRNAVHHWASNALHRDPRSKAHYARLRAAGHSHGRALRGLADRLLSMLVAMLKSGLPYDHARRQQLPNAA